MSATETQISVPTPAPTDYTAIAKKLQFKEAVKRITSHELLHKFLRSSTCNALVKFIEDLNESVKNKKVSDSYPVSPLIEKIISLLDRLGKLVDEIPPIAQPMRFGNKAYRVWNQRMVELAPDMMKELLPEELHGATVELVPYFTDSFGNQTRIDYGTGHELAFVAWLYCLERLELTTPADRTALVLRVFNKYLSIVRKVQTTYLLEPAGSHGVWCLDDYQFLPFYWGSAQLLDHKYIKPKSIHSAEVLEAYADEYIYLGSIAFIKKIKSGPFGEHSPYLNDISGLVSWEKANTGLLKMYRAEVLSKLPVMQHFFFGSIIPFEE